MEARGLSKSKFCTGLQCVRQLWWRVHEPDAVELVASPALQAVFDRGHRVGELAQAEFPGGVGIGREFHEVAQKIADTRVALEAAAPAIYEASFSADGVFVAVDILERHGQGQAIVEVKSTLRVKEQFIPDVAVQLHVVRAAGLDVRRAEVMHLNRACTYPDLTDLFVRQDVTAAAEAFLPSIPGHLERIRSALDGALPVVEPGPSCSAPYECPFKARCWPELPEHHVSTLYHGGRRAAALSADGVETIDEIPEDENLSATAARQARAVRSGTLVVEPGLGEALAALRRPIAFLDFESINPPVPVWNGCSPYQHVPVQMSCHVRGEDGVLAHHAHLPAEPGDPRADLAQAVVRACEAARTVVAYNAPFERACLAHLATHVPTFGTELRAIAAKLVDLLPVVRNHVYHPDFGGSFGLKAVAPALVEGIGYDDLAIGDGGTASAILEALLLRHGELADAERERLRGHLLEYCGQDTLAMARIVERLEALVT